MRKAWISLAAAAMLCASGAGPAAVNVAPNGFAISHEAGIGGPPAAVYQALVGEVGRWWSPRHTYSGDSGNLYIDARPGGCFCETLPGGGGVEHMRVVHVAPGELLRMSGALGPLQADGLCGSLTWKLTAAAEGTTVSLSYIVGGFREGGFEQIAPAVEAVIGEQLLRLKRYVETGGPGE